MLLRGARATRATQAAAAAATAAAAAAAAVLAGPARSDARAEAANDEAAATAAAAEVKRASAEAAGRVNAAAAEEDFQRLEILRNKPLGPNARIVRFKLPDRHARFAYEFGDVINVRALSFDVDESFAFGKRLRRAYIPLQPLDREGHMDIIVKTYPYPDGDTGRYLATRQQGDLVEVSAQPQPRPHARLDLGACSTVAVISAGAGLTAGIQLVRAALHAPEAAVAAQTEAEAVGEAETGALEPPSRPSIKLVTSDKTPSDIFYERELEQLAHEHPDHISVFRTLTREVPNNWDQGVGRVSADMLTEQLGRVLVDPRAKIVVCGPPGFVHHLTGHASGGGLGPGASIGGLLGDLGCADPDRVIIL